MTDYTHTIKEFIIEEFAPDLSVEQLETDYDLLAGGVLDSLGVLKILVWLEDTFQIPADDAEIFPESFGSVEAINSFIASMRTQENAT